MASRRQSAGQTWILNSSMRDVTCKVGYYESESAEKDKIQKMLLVILSVKL